MVASVQRSVRWRYAAGGWVAALLLMALPAPAAAQAPGPAADTAQPVLGEPVSGEYENTGPYNDTFLEGGVGVIRPLASGSGLVAAGLPWTMSGWIRAVRQAPGQCVLAAVGDSAGAAWRGLYLADGELRATLGAGTVLASGMVLEAGRWYSAALTYDGGLGRLYVDGRAVAEIRAATQAVAPRLELAPVPADALEQRAHFGGSLAELTLIPGAAPPAGILASARTPPDFSLITFYAVGVGWPWQERAWRGLQQPQDPWTLPHGHAPPAAPRVAAPPGTAPAPSGLLAPGDAYPIENWRLAPAPQVAAGGEQLSQPEFSAENWYPAVVPGTVLTTLIERGVYPDPDHGLDNLAIPDSLSRQDYWYRSVFSAPAARGDADWSLTFKGINYAAEIWLNGRRLGDIRGAFTRGVFDATGVLRTDRANVIAVRVSPPPHPGIPHEQSMTAGPGNNGGAMAIDGPTFIAAEGWDWIPGIRDRDTGIWQGVELRATGAVRLGDPHVVTRLPLPRIDSADVSIVVPLENRGPAAVDATVLAAFKGVRVAKAVHLQPGVTNVALNAGEFPALHLTAPRLWWPNGYGSANLYDLSLEVRAGGAVSDRRSLRFGVRELSYELSLFDREGRLRRVEVDPTEGAQRGERLIDVRHEAIKRTPQGWAESLTPAGETSPAVRPAASLSLTPYLVIRVNGVPIAARGGSWGMDDSRKRIARERLEPYFRLHREAHLNIIRNWLGQNTEDVFYDLADEYGLLVLNDFWVSTQDFQVEPQDPALFLANARDVIARYRNHPSIAVWFGRNEGVPQPIINEGLADLVATLDGTRYYTGSSNAVNLQGSGPYDYRAPAQYFTDLARGFSVEVGTPSLSTLESLRASIPAADLWPLNDTYAYHDWHFGGNGDVATFMAAMAEQYGAGSDLEDFERKAQLMNYVSYRAIFEGFAAHLWSQNSGRLLWMSHPAWPSNTWQIYSADYDTGAAYYGAKKACEPLHVQMNLPDHSLAVVNTTRTARRRLVLESRVLSLDDRRLGGGALRVDARANATTTLAAPAGLARALVQEGLVLVKLTLRDATGAVLSDNVYWPSRMPADQRLLGELAEQPLELSARAAGSADGERVAVRLHNPGRVPALAAKLTLLDAAGARVLPVYYEDNYLTLLPGETRQIEVLCPRGAAACSRVGLRGWNVSPAQTRIAR